MRITSRVQESEGRYLKIMKKIFQILTIDKGEMIPSN